MLAALKTMKNGKAPGSDLMEVVVLKAASRVILDQLVRLFNGCLRWDVFPAAWKVGSLRVFLKGDLSPLRYRETLRKDHQVAYRLDVTGPGTELLSTV